MIDALSATWYSRTPLGLALAPLGWIYAGLMRCRALAYRIGVLRSLRVGVPVVIVGNIAVGGTGKTPLVAWIARYLRDVGLQPGIVCRGYGGASEHWPQQVRSDSDPVMVGDEAVLLARLGECPVVAGPDRVGAARALREHARCDVIISDDGLQHLRLARDVEVAVVDGERRHGNGRCLPAGPLREPVSRLAQVDLVVANGATLEGEFAMRLTPRDAVAVDGSAREQRLDAFRGAQVHGVAGIGNPERFFRMLESHGMEVIRHPFPDHHPYQASDLAGLTAAPVLMTEKDAVKCASIATAHHWYVPVRAELPPAFGSRLVGALRAAGCAAPALDQASVNA